MGILDKIVGGTVVDGIKAVGDGLDKLFTSDDERLTHAEILERLRQQPAAMQVELNKIEAQHRTVFVAGWRPFIGWVCGFSLGAYYIPQYVMAAYLWVRHCIEADAIVAYPVTAAGLFELVCALLGMGTLRSLDKLAGRAK